MGLDLFGRGTARRIEAELAGLRKQLAVARGRPAGWPARLLSRPTSLGGQRFDMAAGSDTAMTYSWTRTPMSVDEVTERNLRPVRARSRQKARSDEYMIRFLSMVQGGIIGPPGIQLQARITDQPGKLDIAACDAVEAAWTRWGDSGDLCDAAGRLSWHEHQLLFARTAAMDGEYLARLVRGSAAGPFGLQLQVLDPELLDVDLNRKLDNGNTVRFGIEYNQFDRPVAYHLLAGGYTTKRYQRVPATEIIHCYVVLEAGQRRGWPWAYAALMSLNMLGGYEEAAVSAARLGAAKPVIVQSPDDDGPTADAVVAGEGEGDDQGVEYIDANEPLALWRLGPGETVASFDPSYPNGEFDPFTRAVLRRVSAGLNVSYATLTGDMSQANYSSGRMGMIDERDFWMILQSWAIRQFARPVYRAWLPLALLNGQIVFPNGPATWSPEREEKFANVSWQGRRWPWVDPESDVAAQTTAVEQAFTTRSRVMREQGLDPDEIWLERQREDARLRELGISVPVVGQIPGGKGKEASNG